MLIPGNKSDAIPGSAARPVTLPKSPADTPSATPGYRAPIREPVTLLKAGPLRRALDFRRCCNGLLLGHQRTFGHEVCDRIGA